MQYIISGIIGLISGAIGSLLAPWVKWKIEEKKEQTKNAKELILNLRLYLENGDTRNEEFLKSVNYNKIRPYMSMNFIKELENLETTILQSSNYRGYYNTKFLDELDLVEQNWGLMFRKKGVIKKSYQVHKGIQLKIKELE